jgi:hypothetical protein
MNPNQCEKCAHRQGVSDDEGWCFMFRDEPRGVCFQHTGRTHTESIILSAKLARERNTAGTKSEGGNG